MDSEFAECGAGCDANIPSSTPFYGEPVSGQVQLDLLKTMLQASILASSMEERSDLEKIRPGEIRRHRRKKRGQECRTWVAVLVE